ncbi:MAG: L-amino acid N-acyltransferase YncA [Candidatus Thalassarchaeaceae archaeon]|jgi:L-amino acid N-acyltransferase YncA
MNGEGVRFANSDDWENISKLYNEIINEGLATLNTENVTNTEVSQWSSKGIILVYFMGEKIAGFTRSLPYSERECYAGVSQFSIYVDINFRRMGVGSLLLQKLIEELEKTDFWKIVSRVFPENISSRELLVKHGFREVGTYEKHGRLEGKWRDAVIVEYIIN